MKRLLMLSAILAFFTGCTSSRFNLPAIKADEFTYRRTDPAGGTKIAATNLRVEDGKVKADTASWNTTYPQFSLDVTVKNYERTLKPAEAK